MVAAIGVRLSWLAGIAVLACSIILPVDGFTRGKEEELRNTILKGYNNEVRPDSVTRVFMLFHVTSIAEVDIRNEIFSVSGWWSMRWNDDRLTWNETDYPTIPVVQFNENRIWTPVIVVSNSIEDLSAVKESSIPLRVDRHGTVSWTPPGLIKVSCTMNIAYFPFDTQNCGIEVTSFGYTIQEMDVKLFDDGMTFRYYSPSGEWDIVSTDAVRAEYEEDGYTYARVTFYMSIKRKPLYYGLNMLLPVIVCSVLTLFVFLLPPESGEKIGYCLTVLLAFMVILTLVAQDLPTTASSTSVLEIYVAVVLIMGGLSVVMSIFILHIFFLPEDKPIGACTESVIRFFIMACCLEGCCNSQRQRIEPEFHDSRMGGKAGGRPDSRQHHDHHHHNQHHRNHHPSMHDIPRPRLVKEQSGLASFRPESAHSARSGNGPPSGSDVTMNWQLVSRTLDSVLFRIYLVVLVVSSGAFVCILAIN